MFRQNPFKIAVIFAIMLLVIAVAFVPRIGIPAEIPDAMVMDEAWVAEFNTLTPDQEIQDYAVTIQTLADLIEVTTEHQIALPEDQLKKAIMLRVKTDWATGEVVVALVAKDLAYRERLPNCPPHCAAWYHQLQLTARDRNGVDG